MKRNKVKRYLAFVMTAAMLMQQHGVTTLAEDISVEPTPIVMEASPEEAPAEEAAPAEEVAPVEETPVAVEEPTVETPAAEEPAETPAETPSEVEEPENTGDEDPADDVDPTEAPVETPAETPTEAPAVEVTPTEALTPTPEVTPTEVPEEVVLSGSVEQRVQQKQMDGKTIAVVRYTLKIHNNAEKKASENTTIKTILPSTLSYYPGGDETAGIGVAGQTVSWSGQSIAAGSTAQYVFYAKVADKITDPSQLTAQFFMDDQAISSDQTTWLDTGLLVIPEEVGPESVSTVNSGVTITVSALSGTLKPGTEVVARRISNSTAKATVEGAIDTEENEVDKVIGFDITLRIDGQEVQPDDTVQVTFSGIPFAGDAQEESKELVVIHAENAGEAGTDLGAEVSGDTVTVEADHFSFYAVAVLDKLNKVPEDQQHTITEPYSAQNSFSFYDGTHTFSSLAFDFHIFANTVTINNHTNGNIAANDFNGGGQAFGNNQNNRDGIQEVNFFGTSATNMGEINNTSGSVVVIGNSVDTSMTGTTELYIGTNGGKQDATTSSEVYQEGANSDVYINIQQELDNMAEFSAALAEFTANNVTASEPTTTGEGNQAVTTTVFQQGNSGNTIEFSRPADQNTPITISVNATQNSVNYITVSASDLVGAGGTGNKTMLNIIGSIPNSCTVIINVDMTGVSEQEKEYILRNLVTTIDGTKNGEAVTEIPCSVLWNFFQTSTTTNEDTQEQETAYSTYESTNTMTYVGCSDHFQGTILAPHANIHYGALNGSVIANTTESNQQESHNWTFTGLSANLTVYKTLVDPTDSSAKTFYFALYKDGARVAGQRVQSVSVSNGQTKTVQFTNLKAGETYQIYETDSSGNRLDSGANGYAIAGNGQSVTLASNGGEASITNSKNVPQTTTYKVNKLWQNESGAGLPSSEVSSYKVEVQLLNGSGTVVDTQTLKAGNSWSYTWKNLPADQAPYSVKEVTELEGFESSVVAVSDTVSNIINKKINTKEYTVSKQWLDAKGQTLTDTPDSIQVTLFADGAEYDTQTLSADNNWTYTWKKLPANATYSAQETAVPGYEAQTPVTTDTSTTFINKKKYEAKGSIQLQANKSLTGRELKAGEFSFVLQENGTTIQTKTNAADGSITFDEISYELNENKNDLGTHTYTISEVNNGIDGVSYDSNLATITVEVTDNENGTLNAAITGTQHTTFTNAYEATGEVSFSGTKTLKGKDLAAGEFTFVLKEGETVLETVTNDGSGNINFKTLAYVVNAEKSDLGEHTYTITETAGNNKGITYDKKEITIKVTVTDNGDGTLKVTRDVENAAITFTNTYEAKGQAEFSASKTLTGKTLKEGQFTFILEDKDGKEIESQSNDAEGKVTFKAIEYILNKDTDETGSYTYRIREDIPKDAVDNVKDGITYDDKVVTVNVEVSDNGDGTLAVTYDGKAEFAGAAFVNKYATAGEAQLFATKSLSGRELKDGEFEFVLSENGKEIETVSNNGNGVAAFTAIKYTEAGEHTYTIKEKIPEDADNNVKNGVTYDASEKTVTVTVTDNGDGTLAVTYDGETTYAGAAFANAYEAAGKVDFSGIKTLEGKDLADGEFTFVLKEGETVLETVTNDGNGKITFKTLEYVVNAEKSDLGEHTYTITETAGNNKGITYDKKEITIKVTVTDNGDGTLKVTRDVENAAITFTNTYEAKGQAEFSASKTLTGKTLKEGQFTFILEDKDGKEIESQSNDAEGKVTFKAIEYILNKDKDETGSYTYRIREDIPKDAVDNVKDGITYDDKVVTVNVEVSDNGDGTLAVTYDGKAEFAGAAFVNKYATAGEAQLFATKSLSGRELKDGEFEFVLSENGKEIETVSNNGNGVAAFTAIKYTEAGEHTYTIKEKIPTDAKDNVKDGVTYDASEKTVTVTVTDNGKGGLDVTYDGKTTYAGADFANEYNTKGEAVLEASKSLEGKDLTEGEFSFVLKDKLGKEIETVTNAADGSISFSPIEYTEEGTFEYTIQEIVDTEDGVIFDKTIYTVQVTTKDDGLGKLDVKVLYDGSENAPEFINKVTKVSVSKVDVADGSELDGAHIQIIDSEGNVVDEWDSEAGNAHVTEGLKTGEDYTLRETVAPTGYTITADTTFQIDETGKITSSGTVTDDGTVLVEDSKTKIQVSKVDAADGAELDGAHIQILDSEGNVVDEWDSEAGNAHVTEGLKTGEEYTLRETVAPEGYTVTTDTTFSIDETGKITSTGTVTEDGTLLVEDAKTKIQVSKVDVADGTELDGAHIQILDSEGNVVDEWDSEAGNAHVVEGLKTGEEYTLRETVAPEGYTVTTDTTFSIDETGKITSTGTVTEDGTLLVEDAKTMISVSKVDIADGKELAGAVLQIIDSEGNVVAEWTSEETAHVVEGLKTGEEYTLRETVAPEGYHLTSDTTFTIDETGNVTSTGTVSGDGTLLVEDELIGPMTGSIQVTKRLTTLDGTEFSFRDRTFYVALFTDAEGTTMAEGTSIMPIRFQDSSAETVTFENLEIGHTYYVQEVSESGELMPVGVIDNTAYTAEFDVSNEAEVTEENDHVIIAFANQFTEIPGEAYHKGKLNISKTVLGADGTAKPSDETFYAGIFADPEYTTLSDLVDQNIVALQMNGNSSVTAQVTAELHPGEGYHFYITETDANGVPVENDATFAYEVEVVGAEQELVIGETEEVSVSITNKEVEVTVTPTPTETVTITPAPSGTVTPTPTTPNGVKTGDDTPISFFMYLMLSALAMIVAVIIKKRRTA
ncbi:MAG: FctA domain-containing protein [Eubacteriales bacterium]|nr:FctA domain-containing protein [Eubacteriales bacterium]